MIYLAFTVPPRDTVYYIVFGYEHLVHDFEQLDTMFGNGQWVHHRLNFYVYSCVGGHCERIQKQYKMNKEIQTFNDSQIKDEKEICDLLCKVISQNLPEADSKIWHAHPVWFLEGNPIVGYSKLKDCIRLLFWSGVGFEEEDLKPGTGKFKDASIRYTSVDQINTEDLKRWLEKAKNIQWDYKNLIKRKGELKRLK